MNKIICHRDKTITYWSVYNQVWVTRAGKISDRELAAMSANERKKVLHHLFPINKGA